MTSHRTSFALTIALLLVSSISFAQTLVSCPITLFQAPPGDPQPATQASGINRWGNIVGFTAITGLPFIRFTDGRIQTLPIHVSSFANAIPSKRNTFGVTVGSIEAPDGHSRGFVNSGTQTVIISIPGAVDTFVTGINRYGTIVGYFDLPDASIKSFKVKDGKTTILEFRPNTQAMAISDTGVIVGNTIGILPDRNVRGFILINDVFQDFDYPGATNTFIADINAPGMIVGHFQTATAGDNFIFKDAKFFHVILTTPNPIFTNGLINGVNGFGDFTGTAFINFTPGQPGGNGQEGFLGKCNL
jgi:hypothetical protein